MEILESTHTHPPASVLLPCNKNKGEDCFRVDDQRVMSLRKEKDIRDKMEVIDVDGWFEIQEEKKERKAKVVKKKEVSEEVRVGKRLIGLLNSVVDHRPVVNVWF